MISALSNQLPWDNGHMLQQTPICGGNDNDELFAVLCTLNEQQSFKGHPATVSAIILSFEATVIERNTPLKNEEEKKTLCGRLRLEFFH